MIAVTGVAIKALRFLLDPKFLVTIALVVALGFAALWVRHQGYMAGAASVQATLERERREWADERGKAAQRYAAEIAAEVAEHNRVMNELEADNANAEARRAVAEKSAAAAAAAASAAGLSERRLRDALATHRLASAAALEAAGAAGDCSPATAAADLYAELLGRYRGLAGRALEAGRAVGDFAERQSTAVSECADRADTMIRGSARQGQGPPE